MGQTFWFTYQPPHFEKVLRTGASRLFFHDVSGALHEHNLGCIELTWSSWEMYMKASDRALTSAWFLKELKAVKAINNTQSA